MGHGTFETLHCAGSKANEFGGLEYALYGADFVKGVPQGS
jgi:hypothetical protein